MRKTEAIEVVCAAYRAHHRRWKLKPKEKKLIEARLADGYSAEEMCEAIDALHRDEWNLGLNPKTEGRKYLGLHLALGEEKIDTRLEEADAHQRHLARIKKEEAALAAQEKQQSEIERPDVTVSSRELLRQHMRQIAN